MTTAEAEDRLRAICKSRTKLFSDLLLLRRADPSDSNAVEAKKREIDALYPEEEELCAYLAFGSQKVSPSTGGDVR